MKNVGAQPLNLIGISFTNGITFTFTATNAITNLGPAEQFAKGASVGRVNPGVELKLVDDRGAQVAAGAPLSALDPDLATEADELLAAGRAAPTGGRRLRAGWGAGGGAAAGASTFCSRTAFSSPKRSLADW